MTKKLLKTLKDLNKKDPSMTFNQLQIFYRYKEWDDMANNEVYKYLISNFPIDLHNHCKEYKMSVFRIK